MLRVLNLAEYTEQPPFNANATPVGDIALAPNEVLRTWAVKGTGKRP